MTDFQACLMILGKLAIRRQADVDKVTLTVYAEDVERHGVSVDDLTVVCDDLGMEPRPEYQTAFPPIAYILAACRKVEDARLLEAEREWRRKRLTAPAAPALTHAEASVWLERIKAAAHGRKA